MLKLSIIVFLNFVVFISCSTQINEEKELILGEFGAVKGTVLGINNEPLENVNISIYDNLTLVKSVKTDKEGHYIADSLLPNSYTIEAHKNDYAYHIEHNIEIKKGDIKALETFHLTEPIMEVDLKPVIYLYPEKELDITVELDYDGILTHSYPAYPKGGWKVTASPDGTLINHTGQEFYALFWEGKPTQKITPKEGFVIPGELTVAFLEESLATLGLNRREANEFIMFWMPQMENNAYNFISFEGSEYAERASLKITPTPETIIRVMMHTKPLEHRIDIPLQDLNVLKMERKGFTVVEWGGSLLSNDVDL